MKKNRIILYVFYDIDGIVDDYVIYQLQQMRTQAERIVMICQGGVKDDEQMSRAQSVADDVYCRENEGYDAGAWKEAITNYVGWDELGRYDDLILMNDSCYGPIYPINELFDEMDSRKVDFWGITRHGKIKDDYKLSENGIFPMHIQSYFLCFDKKVFTSEAFRLFWNNLKETSTFEESVTFFETSLTKYLEEKGFSWDVYTDCKVEEHGDFNNYNPTAYLMDKLLIEQRNPFIKKKSMLGLLDLFLDRSSGNISRVCLDYIDGNTDYDAGLIYKNILRLGQVRTLYELFHWDYILPGCTEKEFEGNRKTALVMHMYYEELFEYCYNYAKSMPDNSDIYITVGDIEKKKKIEKIFSNIKCNNLEVRLVDNKGMDISAMLIGAKDVFLDDYDYICFMHDKMSLRNRQPRTGEGFCNTLFECMLHSKEYVNNVIKTLEDNKFLGILAPTYPVAGHYLKRLGNSWCGNYKKVCEISEKLRLKCNICEEKDTIAVGTVFWCKPNALRPLFEYGWDYDDFPENSKSDDGDILHAIERVLEYVAQSQGFYTGVVMPVEHAQLVYSVEHYLLRREINVNRKLRKRIKALKKKTKSKSFKIGKAITFVPRKIKKTIK